MTTKNKRILIAVPTLLFLLWLAWYYSDKQVIKRQLNELTWNINKEANEPTLETGLKMREVKQMLAPDVRAVIPERKHNETLASDMAVRYLMYYRDRYETLTIRFDDMLIELPEKGKATVSATVLVQKKTPQADTPDELNEQVEFLLVKDKEQKGGRDWRLTQARVPASLVQ
ncbi:MAG: hypothetical protein SD837_21765 [Candidatus Electrothrix scaldis]|nr:MAG: hypothetical protein SD837_21765 [Candidatus Electrothrix sp. GW3-3]